jgi:hypothetical protein
MSNDFFLNEIDPVVDHKLEKSRQEPNKPKPKAGWFN